MPRWKWHAPPYEGAATARCRRNGADAAVSVAKAMTAMATTLAVNEGVQMHGGIGMTDAYDIGFYMKRARVLTELWGDAVSMPTGWRSPPAIDRSGQAGRRTGRPRRPCAQQAAQSQQRVLRSVPRLPRHRPVAETGVPPPVVFRMVISAWRGSPAIRSNVPATLSGGLRAVADTGRPVSTRCLKRRPGRCCGVTRPGSTGDRRAGCYPSRDWNRWMRRTRSA